MTDDEHLAAILRRYLTDGKYRYWFFDQQHLTLDASVDITPDEFDVLFRIAEAAT